jgi:hypothetical protein
MFFVTALYFFKFHGIVPQYVSIMSTFDPHVGTLVIMFGLSHKVFSQPSIRF